MLVDKVENVLFVKGDVKLPQQCQVFVLKRSATMMLFLILYVPNYCVELRMAI